MKKLVHKVFNSIGYSIVASEYLEPANWMPSDLAKDQEFMEIMAEARPFTMTSPERTYALYNSLHYIAAAKIEGDIVECGVWKGGSMMLAARTLAHVGSIRDLHLFDTFEGMPPPSESDVDYLGVTAETYLRTEDKNVSHVWAYSPLEMV